MNADAQRRRQKEAHRDGRIHTLHVALLHQNLARLGTQGLHIRLLYVLASPELLDLTVEVRGARHCVRGCLRA